MSQHQAILRALAFMEDHIHDPIDVAAVAAAAGYSLYHFCRVFSTHTRHTPYDYLMRRRMTQAAAVIIQSDRKIIDIALDFQFESHEGFTRAFGRMFGCAPTDARQQEYVSGLRRLPRLTIDHLRQLQIHEGFVPTFEELPQDVTSCRLLPVAERWPTEQAAVVSAIPAGPCACFTLHDSPGALPLILDWVLHVWLFYTPYRLREPVVLHRQGDLSALFVPVNPL